MEIECVQVAIFCKDIKHVGQSGMTDPLTGEPWSVREATSRALELAETQMERYESGL